MAKDKTKLILKKAAHDAYLKNIRIDPAAPRPNIVLVFVDDMGYADLSCFGATAIQTPCLDQLAKKGAMLDHFYAASPLCSPSRYACLTGRYPARNFIGDVFFPSVSKMGRLQNHFRFKKGVRGILPDEITMAEALQAGGYQTAMFGKWHLGDQDTMLPNDKGFDYFYGSHYSVDMEPFRFFRNKEVDMESVDKTQITPLLTKEIEDYIDLHYQSPFFIYYASPYPHHPAHASDRFKGKSLAGDYGDCVEELDWSVGQIYHKLEEKGIADNTLFIFTSDNGPWHEGNPGYHRGRKGLSLDGGQAVPCIITYPQMIPAGTKIGRTAMSIDFFPTFLRLAGIELPADREIDGADMMPLLRGDAQENTQEYMYYINKCQVFAVRDRQDMKYIIPTNLDNPAFAHAKHGPYLFDLVHDQNESYDAKMKYPQKTEELKQELDRKQQQLTENPRGWK